MKIKDNISVKIMLAYILCVVFSFSSLAQDYQLNFADPSTYSITCGKVTPGQWSVKNDTCELYTPYIMAEVPEVDVDFTFNVNQSGNGDEFDRGYVYHSIDGGSWELDTFWLAGESASVYELTTVVTLEYGHYVQFMVRLATNDKTEFWAIKDGGIQGSDGDDSQQKIEIYETEPVGLPVSFISFSGSANNNSVILKWATASETNNDYFMIERSEDGISFSDLGIAEGAGNSNEILSYSFTDEYPYTTTFYRLRQTDYDGVYSYSQIIKVSLNESMENEIEISSANGSVYIMTSGAKNGDLKINIFSLDGRLVYNEVFNIDKGSNTISVSPDISRNSVYIVSVGLNDELPVNSKIFLN